MNSEPVTDEEILSNWDDRQLDGLPTFESIVSKNLPGISIQKILHTDQKYWILDVRSEKEFEDSHLPGAESFPILNNQERREVGLLYKYRGRDVAVHRALEFAKPKLDGLKKLTSLAVQRNLKPLVYCWRGGGRSAYATQILNEAGIGAMRITGGHKAYRKLVYQALYQEKIPQLIIFKGLTGVGKTDVLQRLEGSFRVLDLEQCANHCASSFGSIPYELSGHYSRLSQKCFEDGIYHALHLSKTTISRFGIIAESESKRIGHLIIPPAVFQAMKEAQTIEIQCSLEQRVERIYRAYIGLNEAGIPLLKRDLATITPYVSKVQMDEWLNYLETGKIRLLLQELLEDYYDRKYAGLYQQPLLKVDVTDLELGVQRIEDFLNSKPS